MKIPLLLLALILCLTGCDRVRSLTSDGKDAAQAPSGMQLCFACKGTGTNACAAPGCKDGMVDCPGPCLKASTPGWHHLDLPGHAADELWISFTNAIDGGERSWNQKHIGEVVVLQNGVPVNTGKCTVCGGTAKVKCTVCNGTGLATCPICEGKKFVPATWTASDNPKMSHRPGTIELKDGRVLTGKIEMQIGSKVTIRTSDGTSVQVDATEIVPDAAKK